MTKNHNNEPIILVTEFPNTCGTNDFDAFWEWIKKIGSIQRTGHIGKKFCIEIDRDKLDTDDLVNLLGLFHRYSLPNMEQFQQCLSDENRVWFNKKKKGDFWYDDVWGKPFKKPSKKTHKALNFFITLPTFHHRHDEEAFYEWLGKIHCIETITKQESQLILLIPKPLLIYAEDFNSLIALFYRYNLPGMEQFQQFVSDDRPWVRDWKEAYWYKKVWPKKKRT